MSTDGPTITDQIEVEITLKRAALAILALKALEFSMVLGTIAIAPFILVHFLSLTDMPWFAELMKKSTQSADQLRSTSIFLSAFLGWCLFTPIIISLWGAKAILQENVRKSAFFSAFWILYAYETGNYPTWSSFNWLTNSDVVLPIISIIALIVVYFRTGKNRDDD